MKASYSLPLLLLSLPVLADDDKIKAALSPFGITNMEVNDSPVPGLKTVVSDQGIFYATPDARYFLQGSLVEITPDGSVDLSRKPLLGKLEAMDKEMITFSAPEEKYVVTVFTDMTCPYCVRLHEQMAGYHQRGITIRYLAFPRAGAQSKTAQQLEAIWQADDKNAALDEGMAGKSKLDLKRSDIVAKQHRLGLQLGINGTPAMILSNGMLVEGYRQPDELLSILQEALPAD